jgi:hypothetical protein
MADVTKSRAKGLAARRIEGEVRRRDREEETPPIRADDGHSKRSNARVCAESALLLIPRNGSINETTGQTNPAAPLVSKERSVTSSPQTQRKQEREREREREREGERERERERAREDSGIP